MTDDPSNLDPFLDLTNLSCPICKGHVKRQIDISSRCETCDVKQPSLEARFIQIIPVGQDTLYGLKIDGSLYRGHFYTTNEEPFMSIRWVKMNTP